MNKKCLALLTVIGLTIVATVLLCGVMTPARTLTLTDGDSYTQTLTYRVSMATRLKIRFRYRDDYLAFRQGEGGGFRAADALSEELQPFIRQAAEEAGVAPRDATVVRKQDKTFTFTAEQAGVRYDPLETVNAVFQLYRNDLTLPMAPHELKPRRTEAELRRAATLAGEASTSIATSPANRRHNIALAASKIDGTQLLPGASFSFNTVVGPRTEANGFRTAKVISDGEFVEDVGGGVCQLSTTLYNAVLRAGLDVTVATHHSLPVSYVEPSRDAMVSTWQDFCFVNDTDYPVWIDAAVEGDSVRCAIFCANRFAGERVVFRSVIVKEIPESDYRIELADLGAGETERIVRAPKSGFVSELYRDRYRGDALIASERIRRDTYLPQKGLKLIAKSSASPF